MSDTTHSESPDESRQQESTVTLGDLGELPSRKTITTPSPARSGIANRIIWIFGLTILGNLTLNFLLIAGLVIKYQSQPDQIEIIVNKAIIPLLTTTGTFASTLFGPLLAFILGYYFSQRNVGYYIGQKPPASED